MNVHQLILGCLFLYCTTAVAQFTALENRVPHFSTYHFQQAVYNPAFTGKDSELNVNIAGRLGQISTTRKPPSLQAFVQGEIIEDKIGLGVIAQYHDFKDNNNRRTFQLGLLNSFQFETKGEGTFDIGYRLSLLHHRSEYVPPVSPNSPINATPLNERFFKTNLDIGILYEINSFYAGFSVQHANEPTFRFYDVGAGSAFARQYYLMAGYTLPIASSWTITPSFILSTIGRGSIYGRVNDPLVDLSILGMYQNRFFASINYKVNDAYRLGISAGARIADTYQLSIAYYLRKANTPKYTTIEATLGLFFPTYEYEEEEVLRTQKYSF